uniref:IS5 family transposase n=1 Tax=Desulforegula conservatrix TaxID=153026 RepID=UPI0012EB1F9A
YQILDRLSFMRFLSIDAGDKVPDSKTIWLFREKLKDAGIIEELFSRFDNYLNKKGFTARKGQIIDASIVPVPKQRNSREENKRIKNDEKPENWSKAKARQKDTDARWVKKNGVSYFGYKNHVSVDVQHKLIRTWNVTVASVHDSQVFEELIDEDNSRRDVYADSAYRSGASLEILSKKSLRSQIQRKG